MKLSPAQIKALKGLAARPAHAVSDRRGTTFDPRGGRRVTYDRLVDLGLAARTAETAVDAGVGGAFGRSTRTRSKTYTSIIWSITPEGRAYLAKKNPETLMTRKGLAKLPVTVEHDTLWGGAGGWYIVSVHVGRRTIAVGEFRSKKTAQKAAAKARRLIKVGSTPQQIHYAFEGKTRRNPSHLDRQLTQDWLREEYHDLAEGEADLRDLAYDDYREVTRDRSHPASSPTRGAAFDRFHSRHRRSKTPLEKHRYRVKRAEAKARARRQAGLKVKARRNPRGAGLEGPIKLRSGLVVYWDQREGKYYDPSTDLFMTERQIAAHSRGRDTKPQRSKKSRKGKSLKGKWRATQRTNPRKGKGGIKVEVSMNRMGDVTVSPVSVKARKAYSKHMKEYTGHASAEAYLQGHVGEQFLAEALSPAKARDVESGWPVTIIMSAWNFGYLLGYDAHHVTW